MAWRAPSQYAVLQAQPARCQESDCLVRLIDSDAGCVWWEGRVALTHLDLDLLFERSGDRFGVRVVRSPAGDGQSATFTLPVSEVELENFALRIGRARIRTRRQESAPVAAAKTLGGRLFSAVFSGAVLECLRRSEDHAAAAGVPLRIRLRLSDCPELADLPWELLYDAGDNWFLALSGATPVVRYVQLPVQPRPVPVALPLRVLVVRSEPDEYPLLHLDAEWEQVTEALADLTGTGALAVTELAVPTLGELRKALLREQFHILHYMGHGGFDDRAGGTLIFTDAARHPVPVTAEALGVLLRDHASLRLAILNACEAARTDPADPFAGVADTLVRRGIPAVVAMQFEISDRAAVEFAPALYAALASGRPIDTAVAEARKAIYTISPVEWATPVLYLRADDARLFDITLPVTPAVAREGHVDDGGSTTVVVDDVSPELHVPKVTGTPSQTKERRTLLTPEWALRIGSAPAPVLIDAGFWTAAVSKLGRLAKRDGELSGVALLACRGKVAVLFAAVFPDRMLDRFACFDQSLAEDFSHVRRALDSIEAEHGSVEEEIKLTWVHTHRGMAVFLSGTDRQTAREWRVLDPGFMPIVIDAIKNTLADQIGFFDANDKRIGSVSIADNIINDDAVLQIRQAIFRVYQNDALPPPLIITAHDQA